MLLYCAMSEELGLHYSLASLVIAGKEEGEDLLQAAAELKHLLHQQCARLKEEVKEREELEPLVTAAMHQCWDQIQESEQNMEASSSACVFLKSIPNCDFCGSMTYKVSQCTIALTISSAVCVLVLVHAIVCLSCASGDKDKDR